MKFTYKVQTRTSYRPNLSLTKLGRKSPTYEALPPFINKFWQELKKVLLAIFSKIPPNVQAWIKKVIGFLEQDEEKILNFINSLLGLLSAQATGWNHAKFFSVNGTTSVASGYNWWNGYGTGIKAPNYYIFDTYVVL
jgi:hypothetical protein